jgi:hypothetical protein
MVAAPPAPTRRQEDRMRARGPFAAIATLLVAVALAGCTSSPVSGRASPDATESVVPAASAAPRPTATATTQPPPPTQNASLATPVDIPCSTLVPADIVTGFRKGYAPVAHPALKAGTDADRIHRLGGTVCEWKDASTGHVVRIGVARPGPTDLLALKNDLVDRSHSVPTYGAEGYFRPTKTGGISDAFPGPYWLHAASQDYYEPGDAIPFIAAERAAIGAAG